MYSATLISRMPTLCATPRRARPCLTLLVLACLSLAGCSPGVDYPSLFPAVQDSPPPRADAPLDAVQVQQATEDLITARDRLTTEAQSAQSKNSAVSQAKAPDKSAPKAAAKSASKSAAKSTAKPAANPSANSQGKSSTKAVTGAAAAKKPATQVSGREAPASDAAQAGGSETK